MRYLIWVSLTAVLLALSTLSVALADSGPATRPGVEIPRNETPLQAIKRGCDVFDTLDLEAALKLFSYEGQQEERFTRSYCRFAVALTAVELSVVKKFDRKAADDLIHACHLQTKSDVDGSEVVLDGDKATVKLKGAEDPTILRLVDGTWKVSVADMLSDMNDEELKNSMEYYDHVTEALRPIARDLDAGKYTTSDDVVKAVKDIVDPTAPPRP